MDLTKQVSSLKKSSEAKSGRARNPQPVMQPDSTSDNCMICKAKFTTLLRRHHCRNCGVLCCGKCCDPKENPKRVCVNCVLLYNKFGVFNGASSSIKVDSEQPCTLLFSPKRYTTYVAAFGVRSGKHYFEITVRRSSSCPRIGWALSGDNTSPPPMFHNSPSGVAAGVGDDSVSWGYDGVRKIFFHKGRAAQPAPAWKEGDVVGCLAEFFEPEEKDGAVFARLSFSLNGGEPFSCESFGSVRVPAEQLLQPALTPGKKAILAATFFGSALKHLPADFAPVCAAAPRDIRVSKVLHARALQESKDRDFSFHKDSVITVLTHGGFSCECL